MVDPITITLGASAAASGDAFAKESAKTANNLVVRLFGPPVDVLGEHMASALRAKVDNARKVAELADSRIGDRSGRIPPRVGASVFDAAQFADEEIVAVYLSGVLDSSFSEDPSDRGLPWSALIA